MLCTSILSEVVLGFLLWSGLFGTMHTSDAPMTEGASAASPAYAPSMPVVQACPQASSGLPAPMYCPEGMSGQACMPCPAPMKCQNADVLQFRTTDAGPGCPVVCEVPLEQCPGVSGAVELRPKKVCFWFMKHKVTERTATGCQLAVSLEYKRQGVIQTYLGKQKICFDTPTSMVLAGDQPEPVCVQVVARATCTPAPMPSTAMPVLPSPAPGVVFSQPFLLRGIPMMPPSAPVCLPMPAPALPPIYPVQSARIPDPIPLAAAPMPSPYALQWQVPGGNPSYVTPYCVTPVGLSVPAPKPARRASVKLVYESGKARLCINSEGTSMECLRMKLEAGAAGAVRLSAGKNHVHIAGTKWNAQADGIEIGDDGRIVLAGHVKLMSDKLGVCAAVKADRLCVQVKAGKFEKIVDQK